MKKTNTTREMEPHLIEKSFNDMIMRQDAEMLVDFVGMYPHFTRQYVTSLLKRVELINMIIEGIRKDE